MTRSPVRRYSLFLSLVFCLAPHAQAGGLAKSARAVKAVQSGGSSPSPSRPAPPPRGSSSTRPRPEPSDSTATINARQSRRRGRITSGVPLAMSGSLAATRAPCADDCRRGLRWSMPTISGELAGSLQSLRNSDTSARFRGSLFLGPVGLFTSFEQYRELIEGGGKLGNASEDVRMNLYELSGVVRLVDHPRARFSLRLGIAHNSSTHFENMSGNLMATELRVPVHKEVTLGAELRGMTFSPEISAIDGHASVHLSYARLGYRVFKYNVGPALHGPEVGFVLGF